MKNSFTGNLKLRASSAKPKTTETPLNTQKREKLKQLLIEKFVKKFNVGSSYRGVVEGEVSSFIKMEKLTEDDLREFENRLKKMINENNKKDILKSNLLDGDENESKNECKLEISKISHTKYTADDNKSVYSNSNASQISQQLSKFDGIKYDEITNFELRKLLQNDKKPFQKLNLATDQNDEWAAITKFKAQKLEESEKQQIISEKNKKK